MNILFLELCLDPNNGGVERVSYLLAEELDKESSYNTFYSFVKKDSELISAKRKKNISLKNNAIFYDDLLKIIVNNKINIIIVQNPYYFSFPKCFFKIKQERNLKIISVFHANPERCIIPYKYNKHFKLLFFKQFIKKNLQAFSKQKYRGKIKSMFDISDSFVLLSKEYFKSFKSIYKIKDNNKLVSISNPCLFREEISDEKKRNIILVAGRMEESQKRISLAIEIWNNLNHKLQNWELYIVGDGPDLNKYKKIVDIENIKRVRFFGHTTQMNDFYKKSKLFLMTSIWEGLPMTLIEAQSFGCIPCAINNFASLKDIIENRENGLIFNSNDSKIISEILYNFIQEEDFEKISKKAIQSVRKNFSMERIKKDWIKLLEKVMADE